MTRAEAIRQLRRLFGERMYYFVGPEITSPEKRDQARLAHAAAKEHYEAVKRARDARAAELLADPEYQRLKAEAPSLLKQVDRALSSRHEYRFSIGRSIGIGNLIEATGDTWEECFAKYEEKRQKRAS